VAWWKYLKFMLEVEMNIFLKFKFLLVFVIIVSSCVVASAADKMAAAQLRDDMDRLWEDHITYTRNFIISFAGGLPDQDAVAARLMQNQVDIGNAIKTFYGEKAGTDLTALLKEHIQGAVEILKAAKAGDKAATNAAVQKWQANADQIATFLSNANPKNWPLATMKTEMRKHLDLTLNEATHRLAGNYAQDVQDYDQVHHHILGLADTLSEGIMKQFPQKFS
jgi:hypothetical protein